MENNNEQFRVARFCLSEIILYDNKTKKEYVLGGGFNTDLITIVEAELTRAIKECNKIKI